MQEFKPVRYYLEIYEPGSADDVALTVNATGPFMAIAVGDLVNLPEHQDSNAKIFKVAGVEHIVWNAKDHIGHKICVFTRSVANSRESRFTDGPK